MKKFILALFATVMLLSVMPATGFAEEKTANESVVETAGENDVPENWGTEAEDGKALYYIEDGSLLYSENNGRPQTVSSDVNWVIKRGKAVYYAKIEGNNTDIYKKDLSDGSDFEKLTRLFVPVDCFDADGGWLYYLRIQFFKEMLNKHKEGIVIYYWGNNQHAVLLTDYDSTTNTFYCADPANATARGIDVENIAKETEMSVYPDSSQVSDWAADAMRYCIASKVINGDGNGNILPKNYASCAEMATIIVRFIQE